MGGGGGGNVILYFLKRFLFILSASHGYSPWSTDVRCAILDAGSLSLHRRSCMRRYLGCRRNCCCSKRSMLLCWRRWTSSTGPSCSSRRPQRVPAPWTRPLPPAVTSGWMETLNLASVSSNIEIQSKSCSDIFVELIDCNYYSLFFKFCFIFLLPW